MRSIDVERVGVNTTALHEELKQVLGDDFLSVTTRPGIVHLEFADSVSDEDIEGARQAVLFHDARILSSVEQRNVRITDLFGELVGLDETLNPDVATSSKIVRLLYMVLIEKGLIDG